MLHQVFTLFIVGCLCPAVLCRPSVSLQNDENGNFGYQYEVSHPGGSSRVHLSSRGAPSSYHKTPYAVDDRSRGNSPDGYVGPHSPLSSAHRSDSYQAENEARQPTGHPSSSYDPEIYHEPHSAYPSPYDSEKKDAGARPAYDAPVSKTNHSPLRASNPEANYYPYQQAYDSKAPGYAAQEHIQPNGFEGSTGKIPQEVYDAPVTEFNHHPSQYSESVPETNYYPPQQIHDTKVPEYAAQEHIQPNGFEDSTGKIPQEVYDAPVAQFNHHPSQYSGSVPEANYYPPQQIHDTKVPDYVSQEHGHPKDYVGPNSKIYPEPVPVSQVDVPAFDESNADYAPGPVDALNDKPVPVGPGYQFIPSGPPYVVDSHTTEIIHPPLLNDPVVVQKPVEALPISQEHISPEPISDIPIKSNQVPLSYAFQLPLPLDAPEHPSNPSVANVKGIHSLEQTTHDDEIPIPPISPLVVQEPVDLAFKSDLTPDAIADPLISDEIKQAPISHAFRLPLSLDVPDHPHTPSVANVKGVHPLEQTTHGDEVVDFHPSNPLLAQEPVDLSHSNLPNFPAGPHSEVDEVKPPSISHAFRLPILPSAPEHASISVDPSAGAIHSADNYGHSEKITPLEPISHSSRLFIPNPIVPEPLGTPDALSAPHLHLEPQEDSYKYPAANSPVSHSIILPPLNINNGPEASISEPKEYGSSINGNVQPPISHAFRLGFPQISSNQPLQPAPEQVGIQDEHLDFHGPSADVLNSPEGHHAPVLSQAFKLNLPLGPHEEVSHSPKIEYSPSPANIKGLKSRKY